MLHPSAAPLILTLAFDAADQARFDRLRTEHFPPALNHIPAHLALFHHLPGDDLPLIDAQLRTAAARHPPGPLQVTGLRSLGRGVAYTLASPPTTALRATLARAWHDSLTAQDRQGWRPHVTIQNKAATADAARLLAAMQAVFTPFTVYATGLLLWHYRGGPWDPAGTYDFLA